MSSTTIENISYINKMREMSRVAVKAKRLVFLNSVIEYKDKDIV